MNVLGGHFKMVHPRTNMSVSLPHGDICHGTLRGLIRQISRIVGEEERLVAEKLFG
jgi:predicted RNA binding protein YcfA (HicA-like mRNA interferase family)